MNRKLKDTLLLIRDCYDALDNKKAIDIKILKVKGKSSITDYFVIATGTSEPHLRALQNAIDQKLREGNMRDITIDYQPNSGWAVVDGIDFIVHLFVAEKRELYALENLWKDGEIIDIDKLS